MADLNIKSDLLWCCRPNLRSDLAKDHGVPTVTSDEQMGVENSISAYYQFLSSQNDFSGKNIKLEKNKHIAYLRKGLRKLARGFVALDASRTWIVYWCLHSLHLLQDPLEVDLQEDIIDFISRCQCPDGGFGGGPGQMAHLAPTYAAINALATIGTAEALAVVNRRKLSSFLSLMSRPDGSFVMHDGGEVDIRGAYCAVAVARLTRLNMLPLFACTPAWIVSCQTYEGGFSGGPGLEAHGGYTFCGFAALALLHSQHLADTDLLMRWVANRQMRFSGGFQGRTNKLVDGCYSFWQGGLFPILHHTLAGGRVLGPEEQCWLFHVEALQNYLLVCCQCPRGGLIDKPGKSPDYYHTCYTLSGLSVAQHYCYDNVKKVNIVGDSDNELALTHPLHNVGMSCVIAANKYYSKCAALQPNNDTSAPYDSRSCSEHAQEKQQNSANECSCETNNSRNIDCPCSDVSKTKDRDVD